MNLGSQSEEFRNKNKIKAITCLCDKKNGVSASALKQDLGMSSQQLAMFLKRIDEIDRTKKYNKYLYRIDLNKIPKKITYGKEWVKIRERGDKIILKSSIGEEKIVMKSKRGDENG